MAEAAGGAAVYFLGGIDAPCGLFGDWLPGRAQFSYARAGEKSRTAAAIHHPLPPPQQGRELRPLYGKGTNLKSYIE